MPLPTPRLDDRTFQSIVDEAKRLIPQYCPEWTSHNVNDPGIALIELFAWMTEMLLYRVNQVPEKCYVKFLELIGVHLDPPTAARALVSFYLSAPQSGDLVIPKGTEVATSRTDTIPAVVFTTLSDLIIRSPEIIGVFTQTASLGDSGWARHRWQNVENEGIHVFPLVPAPNDAFYIALRGDHSGHVLSLGVGCQEGGSIGVDPENPPMTWEVLQAGNRWSDCHLERDGTRAFNQSGDIVLHLPEMSRAEIRETAGYWLRCRLTAAQSQPPNFKASPEIRSFMRLEALGGNARVVQAVSVRDEMLGISDGTPGQTFTLANAPVLSRERQTDHLVVELSDSGVPESEDQIWTEVSDFGDSTEADRHYTLDDASGTVSLGPALLQPDGSVCRFGAVPRQGSVLRFTHYRFGGGHEGNVPAGSITSLKSSIPYVKAITNRFRAAGGRDAQTLESAKLVAAQYLRSRERAVTAEDFEFHARRVPGVARAKCLAPAAQRQVEGIPPGRVFVIVIPEVETPDRPDRSHLTLTDDLRDRVRKQLEERAILGVSLAVRQADVSYVSVQAKVRVVEGTELKAAEDVRRTARIRLERFLNPIMGGPQERGWPFGRALHLSEIYGLLQRVPRVEFVEWVNMRAEAPGGVVKDGLARVDIEPYGVIASADHEVEVVDRSA